LTARFLLDTNVVSELMRDRPSPAVLSMLQRHPADHFALPDIVFAEIQFGIELITNPDRQTQFHSVLNRKVRTLFEKRLFSANEDTWLIWKRLEHEGRRRRYTYPQPDLVIACIAIQHGLTIVTRDTDPFREAGALFINPWKE
jgi:toxin FitB